MTSPGRDRSFRIRRLGARRSWGLPVPTVSSTVSLRGRDPLAELRLLQSLTTSRRPQVLLQLCGASHEVWSPTAHTGTAGPLIPGLPHPVCSVFRVLHPLDGFLPVRPADCFSSRKRSWGCPLQSFTPHSEAVAPLDARNPHDVDRSANTTVDQKRTAAVVRGHVDKRLASHRPWCGRSSVFRVYCLAGVRFLACGYSPLVRLDALLGFLPLQGIAPPGPGVWRCRLPSSRGLRVPLPSRRSVKIGVLIARHALRSLTQSGGGLPTLVGRLPS